MVVVTPMIGPEAMVTVGSAARTRAKLGPRAPAQKNKRRMLMYTRLVDVM